MQFTTFSLLLVTALQPLVATAKPLIKPNGHNLFAAKNGSHVVPSGTRPASGNLPTGTGSPRSTGSSVRPSSNPKSNSHNATRTPPEPPIWNLKNSSCSDFTFLTAAQQWAAVDGDKVVSNLTETWNKNLLVCPECFGKPKGQCQSNKAICKNGLRDLAIPPGASQPRFDTAAARFANNADQNDLICEIQTGECSGAPACNACNGPGTWAVLKSMETMSNSLQNIYNAINKAQEDASDQMTRFSKDFAPLPSSNGDVFLQMLETIVSGLVGFIPGVGGVAAGMITDIGSSVASNTLDNAPGAPVDTATWLGVISNATQQSYVHVSQQLFQNGTFNYVSKDGKTSKVITMADLMKNGALMQQSGKTDNLFASLVPLYGRLLFQQLVMYTWQYLQQDKEVHLPYIAFDPKPCDQVNQKDKSMVVNKVLKNAQNLDAGVTYKGSCYYLLDAKPKYSETGASIGLHPLDKCEPVHTLPGGTNKQMQANSEYYFGLSLSDFIVPAVEGWLANGKNNGYPSASANGNLIKDPQAPGTVTIPVCDFMKDQKNPGKGCPQLNHKPEKGPRGNGCTTT